MVSYDLNSPTRNREQVEKSIKSESTWCRYLTTTFLIRSNKTIDELQSKFTQHLDSNDRMIICCVEKPIKGYLSQENWNWIKSNL